MDKVFLGSKKHIERHLRGGLGPTCFEGNSAYFVVCDHNSRLRKRIAVDDIDDDVAWADCVRITSAFADGLAHSGDGAMLLVLTRPGPVSLRLTDRRWFMAARYACATYRVRLLGVYVATPRGQREVVLDDAL